MKIPDKIVSITYCYNQQTDLFKNLLDKSQFSKKVIL